MDGDLREDWSLFKLSWTNYADATRTDTKPAKVQVGTFLSIIGKECLKIIKNLPMTEEEHSDINSVIKKLSDNFEPKLNTTYERYVFNSCDQEIGERFDSYLNKLRKLIKTCRYSTEDELLCDRIVMGTNKKEIRSRLLSKLDLTLDQTIDICRSTEQRDKEVDMIGSKNTTETVHYAQKAEKRKQRREHIKDCKFCGLSHDKGKCQAYGLTCTICLKHNHVARMCQSQAHPPRSNNKLPAHAKVRYVNDETASSDESIYALDP